MSNSNVAVIRPQSDWESHTEKTWNVHLVDVGCFLDAWLGCDLKIGSSGRAQLNGSLAVSVCHTSRLAMVTLRLVFWNIAFLILGKKVHTGSRVASRQCVNSLMNTELCQWSKTLQTPGMRGSPFKSASSKTIRSGWRWSPCYWPTWDCGRV